MLELAAFLWILGKVGGVILFLFLLVLVMSNI